jgi:hypothetical protein
MVHQAKNVCCVSNDKDALSQPKEQVRYMPQMVNAVICPGTGKSLRLHELIPKLIHGQRDREIGTRFKMWHKKNHHNQVHPQ